MKNRITSMLLSLVLALSLVGTAFAAAETSVETKNIDESKTVTAALSDDKTYVTLTVSGLAGGEQYLVLMVSGICEDVSSAEITESTIRYIDQASAEGTLTFKVYPDKMESSTILLSGKDVSLTIVATVDVPYKKGDVDGDNLITATDAAQVLRYAAALEVVDNFNMAAAEVDGVDGISASDAAKILRVSSGLESFD